MAITTEAYISRPGEEIRLETISYDQLDDHELLVEITAVSICHTDVRAMSGAFHLQQPLIPGHEGAGIVKDVGRKVNYVQPGDAVVLAFASCGECRRCLSGKQPYCDSLFGLNFTGQRIHNGARPVSDTQGKPLNGLFFGQSSMAKVALVHESSAVKVSCSKDELKLFASLGCGIQTGAGAILNVARPPLGSTIAIFGGGGVGLSAILAAKLTSPKILVLVDNSPTKLNSIPLEILAGVHIVDSSNSSPGEVADKLKSLSPNGSGFDFALDCVGNENVVIAAHTCLDKLGVLINVGSSATAKAGFPLATHLVRGVTVRGTHQGDSVPRVMVPYLIGLWREGKFPFDRLLTYFAFGDIKTALAAMHDGSVIKPLLILDQ